MRGGGGGGGSRAGVASGGLEPTQPGPGPATRRRTRRVRFGQGRADELGGPAEVWSGRGCARRRGTGSVRQAASTEA